MVADGAAPGALLAVSLNGRHYFHGTGRLGVDDPTRPDSATIYDLASLTKVVGLTTAMMLAVEEQKIELDAPITDYVPEFRGPVAPTDPLGSGSASAQGGHSVAEPAGRRAVTIRHLLTHSSGLPAWRPLYLNTGTRAESFAAADTTTLDTVPGARFVYSDLGAMVLTQAVETAYGTRLDTLLAHRVFQPLGLRDTRYLPPADWRSHIAPTENDPWRGRMLRGEVHDENAARLDGVSGHAGLFSSGRDLIRFADWLLRATTDCDGGETPPYVDACGARRGAACSVSIGAISGPPVSSATVRTFTTRQDLPAGSSRALGWDTPSEGGSAGHRLSPSSFGHTGFTGTSIWIDPTRCLAIVLLSNRVHPTRVNPRWGPVRGEVADRVSAMPGESMVTP